MNILGNDLNISAKIKSKIFLMFWINFALNFRHLKMFTAAEFNQNVNWKKCVNESRIFSWGEKPFFKDSFKINKCQNDYPNVNVYISHTRSKFIIYLECHFKSESAAWNVNHWCRNANSFANMNHQPFRMQTGENQTIDRVIDVCAWFL